MKLMAASMISRITRWTCTSWVGRDRLLCLALCAASGLCWPSELLIRARGADADQGRFRVQEGRWVNSLRESAVLHAGGAKAEPGKPGGLGSRKVLFRLDPQKTSTAFAQATLTKGTAAVRFYPMLSGDERLYAYTTWPRGANVKDMSITVHYADGEVRKVLDQKGFGEPEARNSDQWILIGEYTFSEGPDQWVELRADSGAGGVFSRRPVEFYADAVRFTDKPLTDNELGGKLDAGVAGRYYSSPDDESVTESDADVDPEEATDSAVPSASRIVITTSKSGPAPGSIKSAPSAASKQGAARTRKPRRAQASTSASRAVATNADALPQFGMPQLEGRSLP